MHLNQDTEEVQEKSDEWKRVNSTQHSETGVFCGCVIFLVL